MSAHQKKQQEMKIKIEMTTDTDAFTDEALFQEIDRVLCTVVKKTNRIIAREPGCLCDAFEEDDILRDRYGNRIGTIVVER